MPRFSNVYFVSLKIISEHSFFIARMPFCQFLIKSKGPKQIFARIYARMRTYEPLGLAHTYIMIC